MKNTKKILIWIAFGLAISTSALRIFLLSNQLSNNTSSEFINLISYLGYGISLALLIVSGFLPKKND